MTIVETGIRRRIQEDAISLLEDDHAATRELLAMILQKPLVEKSRERVLFVLIEDLWIHLQIEEDIFHPALLGSTADCGRPSVPRTLLRQMISELERCDPDEPRVLSLARSMLTLHLHETADEETVIFPHARRVLGDRALVELGREMRAVRQQLRETGLVRRGAIVPAALSRAVAAEAPRLRPPIIRIGRR